MIDDTNVDFDAGDDDEFGGGLEGSPLTLQEEIELEEAFQGTDEFLTEFRNALDNAGATAVAATTTDTLLFQTPFKSEAGQAITAAGNLVDELEGTAQALTLNEIGDAILASGMEDFFEPLSAKTATPCTRLLEALENNGGVLAGVSPGEVFIPAWQANAWYRTNAEKVKIVTVDAGGDWEIEEFYIFSGGLREEAEKISAADIQTIDLLVNKLKVVINGQQAKHNAECQPAALPPVPAPPGPVQPQPQPPPAAPMPPPGPAAGGGIGAGGGGIGAGGGGIGAGVGVGVPFQIGLPFDVGEFCDIHRQIRDSNNDQYVTLPVNGWVVEGDGASDWVKRFGREITVSSFTTDGGLQQEPYYVFSADKFNEIATHNQSKTHPISLLQEYLTRFTNRADKYLAANCEVVEELPIDDIPPGFGLAPGQNGVPPEFLGGGAGGGGAIPAPDCGEKIQICNWDDLAKILGGGEGGVGGTCKLWESCKSGVIYATSGGQEPRSPDDKPVNAAQMGIPDLQKFIDSCANGGEGEADVGGVAELEAKLKEMAVESGCAVLPAAAVIKDGDFLDPIFQFFTGFLPPGLDKVDGIFSFIRWIFPSDDPEFKEWGEKTRAHLMDMLQKMASAEGCDKPEFYLFKGMEVLVGFLQQWVGGAFTDPLTALQQQTRFYCPISVPSPGEATQAYLADTINRETLECWARAGGMMWDGWAKVVEANRAKLGVNELVQLLRRKEISEVEFNARIRELGFLKPTEANEFKELGNVIPPISDLVRFMVRDTADKTIVNLFHMNEGFPEKFVDDIVDWSTDQGVDKKYMEHVWRAHWSLPSPTQLFSFLHRNSRLPAGDKARVDKEMIEKALIQQDILPFWIPMLMATSYRPLNRVDTRRAFDMGSIDKPQVVEAYLNQGYNDDNANILADFAERVRSMRFLKHQSIRKYAQGAINRRELEQWAAADGATPADFEPMQARAVDVMVADARLECVKSYEKRFQHGELSSNELTLKLNNEMLDAAQVEHIVKANVCKREAAGKQASISQLCKWFTEGILAEHEFFSRLLELNWDADDATRLIRDCQIQREAVLSKEAAKRLSDAMKRSKENERKLKQSAAAREKQRKQAITASRAASTRRLRIAKLLDKAASQYAKKAELEAVEALAVLSIIVKRLKAAVLFTEEEIAQALVFLTKESETTNPEALYVEVVTTLEQSILPTPVEG